MPRSPKEGADEWHGAASAGSSLPASSAHCPGPPPPRLPPRPPKQVLYTFFTQLVNSPSKQPLLQQARPLLRRVLQWLDASFGSAAGFTPSATHVILVGAE